jgi:hypothetical protein
LAGQDPRLLRLEFVVGQHAGVAELTEPPGAGQFDLVASRARTMSSGEIWPSATTRALPRRHAAISGKMTYSS